MNTLHKIVGALALVATTHSAHAALWSVGNEVVRVGAKATLTLSVTGNGITEGSNVDLTIPRTFQVLAARPLSGGYCAILPNANPQSSPDIVRTGYVPTTGAIATQPTPVCEVTVVPTQAFDDWFHLTADDCYDGQIQRVRCTLDPGFVTVLP